MQCGLLGGKLSHSYSPQIHKSLSFYDYSLFEKKPEELENFLNSGSFTGLNVTIPYKKAVIPYCDELSPAAKRLGAVNTLVRRPDGKLVGHNTDYFGFASMVQHSGLSPRGKKVLVLGSGGASNTVVAVLEELGAKPVVISRTGENNYGNLHLHQDAAIVVNATPVGTYPGNGVSPVDLSLFPMLEGVLDLVYNPARTRLLLDGEKRGLVTENGLWMLVAQAKESAEWFSGNPIPDAKIPEVYDSLRKRMQNIILIGMPGCGKTHIGRLLAEKLEKNFADADKQLVQDAGCDIPTIFAKEGEDGFRNRESGVLETLGKGSSLVIATGGGCVTWQVNYDFLHQNGTLVWLKRDISLLPTSGRPLSQAGSLNAMYQARKPLYEAFADITVFNDSTPEDTVNAILEKLERFYENSCT